VEHLVEVLARIPGVVGVVLGGSRAQGTSRPDSDWDFGLYYRGRIDANDVWALGFEGHVVEAGAWGRLVNGGAWLRVEGERVDLLHRDLDFVEHWVEEARSGRFEIDRVYGFRVGMPTYVLAGELAIGKVLHGRLPRPSFPAELRRMAPPRWMDLAAFSTNVALNTARRGDTVHCAGLLAQAAMAAAHARLVQRGEWALNEKGIVARAGLAEAGDVLADLGHLRRS
jgi:predicted nucleotidyltransferase